MLRAGLVTIMTEKPTTREMIKAFNSLEPDDRNTLLRAAGIQREIGAMAAKLTTPTARAYTAMLEKSESSACIRRDIDLGELPKELCDWLDILFVHDAASAKITNDTLCALESCVSAYVLYPADDDDITGPPHVVITFDAKYFEFFTMIDEFPTDTVDLYSARMHRDSVTFQGVLPDDILSF
jgi:hypothetical protein